MDCSKQKEKKIDLIDFTNNNYAGYQDNNKNTSGYAFKLGSRPISWSLNKQSIIVLSTKTVEFVATTSCACQVIWLKKFLE